MLFNQYSNLFVSIKNKMYHSYLLYCCIYFVLFLCIGYKLSYIYFIDVESCDDCLHWCKLCIFYGRIKIF